MSVVFFGTPEFAVPALNALIKSGESISLIVTQPDKVKGRGHKLTPPPVKVAALDAGIRVMQPVTLKDSAFVGELTAIKPEFIVVVAYGKILPKSILGLPAHGCINIHASLLPKYRGAAPIQWAIVNGEKRTGVTTMLIDEGLDTGPVLLQQGIDITDEDTADSLGKMLSETGASLLIETIKGMRDGSVKPMPQQGGSSYAPVIKKEDGLIDWSKSAHELFNFVRGMQPWPCAYCHINDEAVKILKAAPVEGKGEKGVIVKASDGKLFVGTGYGLLSIIELQPPGKRPMPASAFILGRRLKEGMSVQ